MNSDVLPMRFLLNCARSARDNINCALFLAAGSKPWTRGYAQYRIKKIKTALSDKSFNPSQLPRGYGFRVDERVVEYPWLFSRLPATSGKLLDAGSILNVEYVINHPSLQSKQVFISTLAPEPVSFWQKGVSYIYEDLRSSCFKNDYFDWIVSLSTVEHIGLDNTMLYTGDTSKKENDLKSYLTAIREFHRMLKPAGTLYLSFPFGQHKNHSWFQIFNSAMVDEVIATFSPKQYTEYHFRYEAEGWRTSTREDSKNATYFDIHQRKSHDPDYAAASRAIVCLELKK